MNNKADASTAEKLRKIEAKITLELPLTDYEQALWTLYGKRESKEV